MPEFLLELGTEELPASFVQKAYTDLLLALTKQLEQAGVLGKEGTAMGTPRRQIISFPNLLPRQSDSVKEQRGPALKAAYDTTGRPTPALLGFCRSEGVEVGDLRKDEQYVWATKKVVGRPTEQLLTELVPQVIRTLSFEKSMRWGASRMRFARPIRWILAAYDGVVVPFEIEGVAAGTQSYGHRFYSPEPFKATSLQQLVDGLRARKVEPDPEQRRAKILAGAQAVASGSPVLSDALVDENVFLTEWPTPIRGEFKEEFLQLPEPVLVTAMAKHEKMFPIRGADGKLTNSFVFARNSGEDETVRRGSEWVLNARFNDAKFFFDEDAKASLAEFLERTSGIVFQEKLGNVRERADRLSSLAAAIATSTGGDVQEVNFARQAGLYAKADLASGLVSELASLQGIIGGEYAKREGMPAAVSHAMSSQYDLARAGSADTVEGRTALRLAIADALDKLAGYFGLGLEPSGSSDPFGLRRAGTVLIEAAWKWPAPLPSYSRMLHTAIQNYSNSAASLDSNKAETAFAEIFASRYQSMLPNVRHDLLEAAMLREDIEQVTKPRAVRFRVGCLEALASDTAFVQTATRPMNIVISARKKEIEFGQDNPLQRLENSALESAEGLQLLQTLVQLEPRLAEAEQAEDQSATVEMLRSLQASINAFFESTMVMADQPEVRYARLTLMHACSMALLRAGDFTRLVVEGA